MKKPWFKPRESGLGWTPVSSEGWAVVLVFMGLTLATGPVLKYAILSGVDKDTVLIGLVVWLVLIVAGLSVLTNLKSDKDS